MRELLEGEASSGLVRERTFDRDHPELGRRTYRLTAQWVRPAGANSDVVVLETLDVTAQALSSRQHEALEQKVEERTRALDEQRLAALRLAESAEKAKLETLDALTALQRSDVQLRQSQKMEAVGKLAGGVAHDFNNLLTAILGFSSLVMETMDSSDPNYSDMVEIQKASTRASNLTAQLLSFSQKRPIDPRVIDANQELRDLERMLRRLLSADIELLTHLDMDVGSIRVDPTALEQVVVNLAVNARDAMPNGGQLVIETAMVTLGEGYSAAKGVPIPPGDYVTISLSDTGLGIDEKTQEHIFEPFFTTKAVGKGTGLGLSTVYGIVKQAGGFLWVYSEVGKGTTFRLYFPRVGAPASKRQSTPHRVVEGGAETILVVDDEEQIRLLCGRALTALGYRVLLAASGAEALELCEQNANEIDLLLSDVVMPRMSGTQLAMRVGQKHPEIKVLFMSGYTPNAIVHHGVMEHGAMLLQKPFTPDGAALKVREVLSADAYYAGKFAKRRPRVLLVDEDTDSLALALSILSEDYDVTSIDTAEQALEQIKLSPPEVIVCACTMTGLDGPELYRSIFALNPHLVDHFLFTAGASDGDRDELLRGIERPLIRKPFDQDVLRDAVHIARTGRVRMD